jgi:pimeloyl-ACP methyl ester carboxylesterase
MGEADAWHQRADVVRRAGMSALVASSPHRWFAPGFTERDPRTAAALLTGLTEVEPSSYAWACEALAAFDLRGQVTDVVVVAGEQDVVVPPDVARDVTRTVRVLEGCGHLPPAEDPAATAALLTELLETREAVR